MVFNQFNARIEILLFFFAIFSNKIQIVTAFFVKCVEYPIAQIAIIFCNNFLIFMVISLCYVHLSGCVAKVILRFNL